MFFIPTGTRESEARRTFPYVNVGIVLACIAIFAWQVYITLTYGEASLASFINAFAANPSDVTDSTPLEVSLLTSMFLHGGLLHLAGNMIYLLPFGDNIEDRLGHFAYLLFYVLCGLFATLGFIALNPDSTVPLLGASGAIAGVLGGYLVLHPTAWVKGYLFIIILLTRVELPALLFIGYWFVMQVFSSVADLNSNEAETGGVAFAAHVAGFIAGVALMPIFKAVADRTSKFEPSEPG